MTLNRQEVIKKKKKKKIIWNLIKTAIVVFAVFFYIKDLSAVNNTTDPYTFKNGELKANIQLVDKTVMQSFAVDEENQYIYVSQVKSGQPKNSAESFVITRCSMDGKMLDSMTLKYGGHGTNIGVEVQNNSVYIWSSYDRVNQEGQTVGFDLVRFEYKAGATYTPSSPELEKYSNLINGKSTVQIATAIDNKNRRLAVRQRDSFHKEQWVDIYNLDDVTKYDARKLHTIHIPENILYLQGLSLAGNYLYWRTGDTNGKKFQDYVTIFDISTGKILKSKHVSVDESDILNKITYREPEGIFMYTDPKTAIQTLLVGVVTKEEGKNYFKNKVYTY